MFIHNKNTNAHKYSIIFFSIALMISLILFTHINGPARMIIVDKTEHLSLAEPMLQMNQVVQDQGLQTSRWTVYWRGTIQSSEREAWQEILAQDENFLPAHATEANGSELLTQPLQDHGLEQDRWTKTNANGDFHELQLFENPQEGMESTKYIYMWSGEQLSDFWTATFSDIHSIYFEKLQQSPQIFSCIEAFTNDTLNVDSSTLFELNRMVTGHLSGEIVYAIDEPEFASVNAYIPEWENHSIVFDGQKMNMQLSARTNKLENKTHLTLGYPLILIAH